jgi:hypothetical protein
VIGLCHNILTYILVKIIQIVKVNCFYP